MGEEKSGPASKVAMASGGEPEADWWKETMGDTAGRVGVASKEAGGYWKAGMTAADCGEIWLMESGVRGPWGVRGRIWTRERREMAVEENGFSLPPQTHPPTHRNGHM